MNKHGCEFSCTEPAHTYVVCRPCYDKESLRKEYRGSPPIPQSIGQKVKDYVVECTTPKQLKNTFFAYFAIFQWLPRYRISECLLADIIAGITIFVVQLPQGIAYGKIAGLSPMQGIYASCFPLLSYFLMSKSRFLSVGPTMTTSVLLGSIILRYTDGAKTSLQETEFIVPGAANGTSTGENQNKSVPTPLELAIAITFVAGLYQILIGILHLDFLFVYLSKPFVGGYILANVLKLTIQELSTLCGVETGPHSGPFDTVYFIIDFFQHITTLKWVTTVISLISLVVLFVSREYLIPYLQKKCRIPLPIELIVVIIATVGSHYLQLKKEWNVNTVGHLESGIPTATLPPTHLMYLVPLDGFNVAIISLCFSMTLNNLFAAKYSENIDNNKEFVALGVSNIVSSVFCGMPIGGAISRSMIQETVGGKTQVVGIATFAFFILSLLVLGTVLTDLPQCVLSAIIIISFKDCLKTFKDFCKLWDTCKLDALVWLVALCGTILVNLTLGLWIGLGFNVLVVLYRTQRAKSHLLGIILKTNIYVPLQEYEACEEIPKVKIFRFDGPLLFNSREHFASELASKTGIDVCAIASSRKKLEKATANNGTTKDSAEVTPSGSYGSIKCIATYDSATAKYVVIDCSAISSVDTPGLNHLQTIYTSYKAVDIEIILTDCNEYMYEMMEKAGFFEKFPQSSVFISIHDAIISITERQQIPNIILE